MNQSDRLIGFICREEAGRWPVFLKALARSCGLGWRSLPAPETGDLIGVVVFGDAEPGEAVRGLPQLRLVPVPGAGTALPVQVHFSGHAEVPEPFRGRSLQTACVVPEPGLTAEGLVLATAQHGPVWTREMVDGSLRDTCRVPADGLAGVKSAFDRLNGRRFMELLPVLEWLRTLVGFYEWVRPPVRACLMFDDPNLHSLRYGFVDYVRIAEEGKRHGYHTAFATVPFDLWYVNSAAARCFRDHAETLSLLVHGNNHTHRELTGGTSHEQRLARMRQALRRTRELKAKSGLEVSRVMAPPHGACSEAMMQAMAEAGFEAACISPGSVRSANPEAPWTDSLGLEPACFVAGLPVIPRFRLDASCEGAILVAAYLDQPIIPVGHHWDLADGTDLLTRTAGIINSLGDVVWGDLSRLSRGNYRYRVAGGCLRLRPFCRKLTLRVPAGVDSISIEAPWNPGDGGDFARWAPDPRDRGQVKGDGDGDRTLFRVVPGSVVTLEIQADGAPVATPELRGTPPLVIARRVLVEMRDRAMPLMPVRWQRR